VEDTGGKEIKGKFQTGSSRGIHNATIASVLREVAGSLFKKFGFFMDSLRSYNSFFNLSVRCGWVFNATPQLLYHRERDPACTVHEAELVPEPGLER
jgi:hypothetical protein